MNDDRIRTRIQTDFVAGPVRAQGKIRNLGSRGLFIRTESVPAEGDSIRLRFEAPDGEPVSAEGLVWWTTRERERRWGQQGFGVCLLAASASYRAMIDRMIR